MPSKKEILVEYIELSMDSDSCIRDMDWQEKNLLGTEYWELRLIDLNQQLAKLEDDNPWIANVLIAMEGEEDGI